MILVRTCSFSTVKLCNTKHCNLPIPHAVRTTDSPSRYDTVFTVLYGAEATGMFCTYYRKPTVPRPIARNSSVRPDLTI